MASNGHLRDEDFTIGCKLSVKFESNWRLKPFSALWIDDIPLRQRKQGRPSNRRLVNIPSTSLAERLDLETGHAHEIRRGWFYHPVRFFICCIPFAPDRW